mgnify:CR=1 FL=1
MVDLPNRFRPAELINWALRQHIYVPKELLHAAVSRRLPIVGFPDPMELLKVEHRARVNKAEAEVAKANARNAALEAQALAGRYEIDVLTDQIAQLKEEARIDAERTRSFGAIDGEAALLKNEEPLNSKQKLSAATRKHNTAVKLLFGLVKSQYDVDVSGLEKPKLQPIIDKLAVQGITVDDATLRAHLLAGSELAAK